MSAQRLVYIFCDHPECHGESPWSVDVLTNTTATEQRAAAAKQGWKNIGRNDYCKKHARALAAKEAK